MYRSWKGQEGQKLEDLPQPNCKSGDILAHSFTACCPLVSTRHVIKDGTDVHISIHSEIQVFNLLISTLSKSTWSEFHIHHYGDDP